MVERKVKKYENDMWGKVEMDQKNEHAAEKRQKSFFCFTGFHTSEPCVIVTSVHVL